MKHGRRRVVGRELALLLVPVLAFAAWGLWLQNRGPFKLVIDEVQTRTFPRGRVLKSGQRAEDVEVAVFVGHQGQAPSWWGEALNAHKRVNFTAQGQKDDGFTNEGFYPGSIDYNSSRGEYVFLYEGNLPEEIKSLKGATCHVNVLLITQTVPNRKLASASASIPAKVGSELVGEN